MGTFSFWSWQPALPDCWVGRAGCLLWGGVEAFPLFWAAPASGMVWTACSTMGALLAGTPWSPGTAESKGAKVLGAWSTGETRYIVTEKSDVHDLDNCTQAQRCVVLLVEQRTCGQLVVGGHHVPVRTPPGVMIRCRGVANGRLKSEKNTKRTETSLISCKKSLLYQWQIHLQSGN